MIDDLKGADDGPSRAQRHDDAVLGAVLAHHLAGFFFGRLRGDLHRPVRFHSSIAQCDRGRRQVDQAPVVGARDTGQLTGSLAAEEITLPPAIRSALDDVSAIEVGYPERWPR